MTKLEHALALAAQGFYVFPIVEGKKAPPRMEGWQRFATRDKHKLQEMWASHPNDNIGISTGRFGKGQALLVVDIDNKGDKHGDDEIALLDFAGFTLPPTREHSTPSGGRHLLYVVEKPVRQGANLIAPGVDVRSRGGYVVAPGSDVDLGTYGVEADIALAPAPVWLIERCGKPRERQDAPAVRSALIDAEAAEARATHYLLNEAPLAADGAGGDEGTYKVAARVKDFGVTADRCEWLMFEHWNPRCSPPWSFEDLQAKVANAYRYGRDPVGVAAPEAQFEPVVAAAPAAAPEAAQHPFEILNRNHAFVIAGGGRHILFETKDVYGNSVLEHLDMGAFHDKHAAWKMNTGRKDEPVTKLWMEHTRRRSYDGMCFMPGQTCPPNFYNLFRGFAYEPLPPDETPSDEAQASLDAFLDHARNNVCRGSEPLFSWLIGFFAHLVQRPWEKPLVALVFRGGKGVGKNALVERIGSLLGGHFLLTSNRRYLVGNFNGHLENCLMFALDEAFWSGDKQAEGTLKDIITGSHHVIEHKGKETFKVDNRTRVCIIGNEDWLVPATHDERRFAVFDVGDGRKQDRSFFENMRLGMERGGYRLLLRHLLAHDLSGFDVNAAPDTKALLDQKHASLSPVQEWWYDSLHAGQIQGGDFEEGWTKGSVEPSRLMAACNRYLKARNIHSRNPSAVAFGMQLHKCCEGLGKARVRVDGRQRYLYDVPDLATARAEWDKFIGSAVEWP